MASELAGLEQAAGQSRETQLRFLLNVASRRWMMIVAITLAVSAVWGVVNYMRNPPRVTYVASTDLVVKQSPGDKAILQVVGAVPLTPTTPRALIQLVGVRELAEDVARALVQQDLADGGNSGRAVLEEEYASRADAVRATLNIAEDPSTTGMIHITATNADKDLATSVAEFAARVFVNRSRQMQVEQEEQTYDVAKHQLDELRTSLEKAENAKWEFEREMGFQAGLDINKEMQSLNDDLRKAEAESQETQARRDRIAEELKLKNEQLPQALGQITDNVVKKLYDELTALVQEHLELSIEFQPTAPQMQDLTLEINDKKKAILDAVTELQSNQFGSGDMLLDIQNLRREYTQLDLDQTAQAIRIATAKRLLEEMLQKIPELSNMNHRYEILKHEAERVRGQFTLAMQNEFQIRTSMGMGTGQVSRNNRVTTVSQAPPLRVWFNFVIGGVVGLLFGFALAMMLEMADTSIRSLEDVTDYIGLEVIGTIPKMKFGKTRGGRRHGAYIANIDEEEVDACIVTQHDPKSPISESYRTLRTNFQFATIQLKPKTMMITSAVPGEGKTTTAVNLAVTMADRGIRVLLIDTDLRRPNVHRVLKIERGPGLSDVLRENLDVHTVIRKTRIENLSIISSGRVPPNPSELIASERMENLVKQLGSEFDLVICDAPSILVVTDPVLLATHVDTVVLVVSVANARRETIQRAKKLLEAAKAHVAGVVLNGLEATRRHYYYYYYYYDDVAGHSQRRWYHL